MELRDWDIERDLLLVMVAEDRSARPWSPTSRKKLVVHEASSGRQELGAQ